MPHFVFLWQSEFWVDGVGEGLADARLRLSHVCLSQILTAPLVNAKKCEWRKSKCKYLQSFISLVRWHAWTVVKSKWYHFDVWMFCVSRLMILHHHHHHLSLNREGHWGTTDDFPTSFSIFPHSPLPSGIWQTPGLSIPDVVFPPLPLSALSSSPFHCALQDGFGQTRWTGDMTIPLQFAFVKSMH